VLQGKWIKASGYWTMRLAIQSARRGVHELTEKGLSRGFVHKVVFVEKVGGIGNLNRRFSPRNQRTEACVEKVMPIWNFMHKALSRESFIRVCC
jgi:hypothetical protein